MERKDIKQLCDESVEENLEHLSNIASYLYMNPEIAFKEHKACKVLCRELREQGFTVQEKAGGLDTAFHAVYKKGEGLRIGVIAEYDALADIGHACGHQLIATSAMGAALAVKKVLDESNLCGSIEVFGTPAEEEGGGKIIMLDNHVFDGVDVLYFMHPTSAITRIGGECASFTDFIIEYHGKSAHAESHPENGINALDAAVLFYQGIGLLRQQLKDDIHICCILPKTNQDIGRISDYTKVEVEISTMHVADIAKTREKIYQMAEGMAMATGCKVHYKEIPGYLGRTPNAILGDLLKAELTYLKEPLMEGMPADKGGEDLGNVSRVIPACNLFMTLLPERKISGHTEEFRELANGEAGRRCLKISAIAMARAIVEILLEPTIAAKAKAELQQRIADEVAYA